MSDGQQVAIPLGAAFVCAGARSLFFRATDGRVFEVDAETALWREVADGDVRGPRHVVGNVPAGARWIVVHLAGDAVGVEEPPV